MSDFPFPGGGAAEASFAKSAFGAIRAESLTPIAQISAEYGLLEQVLTVVDSAASGTSSVIDNQQKSFRIASA